MDKKLLAAALVSSKDAKVVEISHDITLPNQAALMREFMSAAVEINKAKSVILIAIPASGF